MKLLKDYFALEKQIHDYFGYKEDWVSIPLSDQTDAHWKLNLDAHGGGDVTYNVGGMTEEGIEDGDYFSVSIYTQRFLSKWVYRGDEFTMVCADTHTDGNKFLMIFNNKLEIK